MKDWSKRLGVAKRVMASLEKIHIKLKSDSLGSGRGNLYTARADKSLQTAINQIEKYIKFVEKSRQ